MRIARIGITPFSLPLRRALVTAHGVLSERAGFAVQIKSTTGLVGCGEALPLHAFGTETGPDCSRALARLAPALLGRAVTDLDATLDLIDALAPSMPTARAALDIALHDLLARHDGVSVATLLRRRCAAGQSVCQRRIMPSL